MLAQAGAEFPKAERSFREIHAAAVLRVVGACHPEHHDAPVRLERGLDNFTLRDGDAFSFVSGDEGGVTRERVEFFGDGERTFAVLLCIKVADA
jgi:hypothetical protein